MENRFENKNGDLFIDGKKVLHGWESFTGWYWFAVEKVEERASVIDGRRVRDTIWFGLVQGIVDEWGYFSQAEIEALGPRAWKIRPKDLAWAGRRGRAGASTDNCCDAGVSPDERVKWLYQAPGVCGKEVRK